MTFGPTYSFHWVVLTYMLRTILYSIVCTLLGWIGIMLMDRCTPGIRHRRRIGESPIGTAIFLAGFFIYIGLVIHGVLVNPVVIGASILQGIVNPTRLVLVCVSFFVTLIVSLILFYALDRITPRIPFKSIKNEPIAAAIHVFGYFVFFGLIIHAALSSGI
ncbi:MAG: DUF350 domain-containing protein [Desulfobacterales bacterium]|nr:DUF350 domain-containing protein [Desulfobacterales bacterium]